MNNNDDLEQIKNALRSVESKFSDVGTGAGVSVTFCGSSMTWGYINFQTEWKSFIGEIEFNGDLIERLNELAAKWENYR